jgi:transposase
MIHFIHAEKELLKNGVSRQLLWLEYKEQHTDGYNYSQYCYHFNIYLKHKDVVMHLEYEASDMIMIDFADKRTDFFMITIFDLHLLCYFKGLFASKQL